MYLFVRVNGNTTHNNPNQPDWYVERKPPKYAGSHRQGPVHFKAVYEQQYRKLKQKSRFQYHIHDGVDTMPEKIVVEYFREVFGEKDHGRQ